MGGWAGETTRQAVRYKQLETLPTHPPTYPGIARATQAASVEKPFGSGKNSPNLTKMGTDKRTVMQQHVDFFDRDNDGVISMLDTFLGCVLPPTHPPTRLLPTCMNVLLFHPPTHSLHTYIQNSFRRLGFNWAFCLWAGAQPFPPTRPPTHPNPSAIVITHPNRLLLLYPPTHPPTHPPPQSSS